MASGRGNAARGRFACHTDVRTIAWMSDRHDDFDADPDDDPADDPDGRVTPEQLEHLARCLVLDGSLVRLDAVRVADALRHLAALERHERRRSPHPRP